MVAAEEGERPSDGPTEARTADAERTAQPKRVEMECSICGESSEVDLRDAPFWFMFRPPFYGYACERCKDRELERVEGSSAHEVEDKDGKTVRVLIYPRQDVPKRRRR